jgi:hypothetical protein
LPLHGDLQCPQQRALPDIVSSGKQRHVLINLDRLLLGIALKALDDDLLEAHWHSVGHSPISCKLTSSPELDLDGLISQEAS